MKYQLSTYGGRNIILEEKQYRQIVELYDSGATEFVIGEQRIPRSSISFLGFTADAAEEMRIDESNYIRKLSPEETKRLKEKRYEDACRMGAGREVKSLESAKERVWKSISAPEIRVTLPETEQKALGMTSEESEQGKAEYWIDENGQRMYS